MKSKRIPIIALWIISPLLLFATDFCKTTTDLYVRSGAGKEYSIVYTLQKGDEVEVLSKIGNWYKIRYSGKIGYAHSQYLISTSKTHSTIESYFIGFCVIIGIIGLSLFERWRFGKRREQRREQRRDYYRNVYLQSDEWQRKRHVVFKRDNWRCVYCGSPATQVHHKRYAKYNIGKEPIEWLVSICKPCHEAQHN